jgi:hypothetical protein
MAAMTPEAIANALAFHYDRTQSMTFEACRSFDERVGLLRDRVHADPTLADKAPDTILSEICGPAVTLDPQSPEVVESMWAIVHYGRLPQADQEWVRRRADEIGRERGLKTGTWKASH